MIMMMQFYVKFLLVLWVGCAVFWPHEVKGVVEIPSTEVVDCYTPIGGGWKMRMSAEPAATRMEYDSTIGVVEPNPSPTRRPLYPPADRSLVWTEDEIKKIERCGFRPLVMAYTKPRFLFDFHAAGGLLGHLFIGLETEGGASKWFHQWSEIDVRYVDGRMDYTIQDKKFPGTKVSLSAAALAESVGIIVKIDVKGKSSNASLVWGYGGASAYSTNWNDQAKEWTFASEHCSKDLIQWQNNTLALHRVFDKSDTYTNQSFAAVRYLPNWKAVMRGGSSWEDGSGFGEPSAFSNSPRKFVESAQWCVRQKLSEKRNCVALQRVRFRKNHTTGFVVVGMGGNIEDVLKSPSKAYRAALGRNRSIAERIVIHTPDPYLDASMPMIAFSTEGIWGDSSILHGAYSWRFAYLGWRGWYGPTAYGWTDRVKKSIWNHTRLSLIKDGPNRGGLGHMLEQPNSLYYNMNEVFFDQVRQYFDYTNDLDLMREIFPILQGIVKWESRRLQPENEYLYENALNTWISDGHWYIGAQCTQASAYMLGAHKFLADLAERLDKNPTPFKERAGLIRDAMQRKLWMWRLGVFAESLDTRGNRMLHTEPELPTIYHSAEFGAASPLQIYQMLHWAETHLESVLTPGGGRLYWSSNWFPNRGRSYTHSTYELAYAEELNLALTNYLVGRNDEAYSLIRGVLCGIYNEPTPGGLACHAFTDGRRRANDEFADAISMWGRVIAEGLFGIVPKRPDGLVQLTPQFPSDWPRASIRTPHFSYHWKRKSGKVSVEWESAVKTVVHLRLPLRASRINAVKVNGKNANYTVEPGVGLTWLSVNTPRAKSGAIEVKYAPAKTASPKVITVTNGGTLELRLADYHANDWLDPQGILDGTRVEEGILKGVVNCEQGPALMFLAAGTASCPMWLPLRLSVEPREAAVVKVWSAPDVPDRDLQRWFLVDLSGTFNSPVTEVLSRVGQAAKPPRGPASQVGFSYWKSYLTRTHHGTSSDRVSDAAWRSKVGSDDVAWTTDGIPFKSSKTGDNIAVVTLAGGYPSKLEFPVGARGKKLYLMLTGTTFPAQSHVVNLRVVLKYSDSVQESLDLVSPFDIGDCWAIWCGRFHDTAANGFENISGISGPAGSAHVEDMTQPINVGDIEAHLVSFDLKPDVELRSVEVEAIANDVVFGVMGATIFASETKKSEL